MANSNIEFLGYVPDDDLPDLFARCRAFVFPGEEDFGIAPIQAMAAGRPVIAYAGGGSLDTVIPGRTGVFFTEQSPQAIADAVESFDPMSLSTAEICEHAQQYDVSVFRRKMLAFIDEKLSEQR
jgi:glycosyltransferase involved in cell wall biosynthesis